MLYFSKLKITLISLICLIAIYFAMPSFLYNSKIEKNDSIKNFLPSNKVNLGLDLQGGSQLLIEVDFKAYLQEQNIFLKEEIKKTFADENVRTLVEISGDKINFSLTDEAEQNNAKELLKKLSRNLNVDQDNNVFSVSFSDYEIDNLKKNLLSQSIEIIRRRIDENGTKEPTIVAQGENRILLQVPGVKNSDELKNILGKTAKMTFHLASNGGESFDEVFQAFDNRGNSFSLKKEVMLSGDLLIDASATYHEGKPAVAFRFNTAGTRKFAEITQENVGKIFAIILDGKVVTAPVINTVINQGNGVISGSFDVKEASEVALLLRSGALPTPLLIVEERSVGPSLGSDSIKSGQIACLVGLILVSIFMVIFYGYFGLIANIALVVNIAIIISVLSLLSATLTLPGIAGIVLTMGMAVDANVLIFERIKEELASSKSILPAIEKGFGQAYRAIIDSNITTLIVAFFLYVFGNGSIKGFAVTLSIGITSSMFTAILLTRMLIVIWIRNNKNKKPSLI
ncbi:MAG: protein translocase subunit SecD [Alphaproteobacteria bacterium]